jgi:hypothetical protein
MFNGGAEFCMWARVGFFGPTSPLSVLGVDGAKHRDLSVMARSTHWRVLARTHRSRRLIAPVGFGYGPSVTVGAGSSELLTEP